ncbi:MAG: hypothetical protein A2270_10295 [Elusimicrobia bacterium RIFOXYA12_FULL_51_18]|nr:MAG: hypothetical protein A2270_10295 [Elusimicrobia bacterium RIFOXYA12_FULL_51_18]OGS29545.1 MAG: hypothetical protein A2218_00895 [Elusimicrobia bacterium RIFOXYA2_FULL_53_38]
MKKEIIIAAVLSLMSATAFAADKSAADSSAVKRSESAVSAKYSKRINPALKDVLPKIDAIQREMLDLDVMYWAWRIADGGRTTGITYEQLEGYSKNWIMTSETKELFLARLKAVLDGKTSRPLTAPERKKLDENKAQIVNLLSPARSDSSLINSLSVDYCVELEARYWAHRIQTGEKEILESMKKWDMSANTKRITEKVNKNLTKKLEPLTKEERYKLDACIEKLSKM